MTKDIVQVGEYWICPDDVVALSEDSYFKYEDVKMVPGIEPIRQKVSYTGSWVYMRAADRIFVDVMTNAELIEILGLRRKVFVDEQEKH